MALTRYNHLVNNSHCYYQINVLFKNVIPTEIISHKSQNMLKTKFAPTNAWRDFRHSFYFECMIYYLYAFRFLSGNKGVALAI